MKDKNYAEFLSDQLAGDVDFQRWVLRPNENDLLFWQDFLSIYPDQLEKIYDARRLVLAAYGMAPTKQFSTERKKHLHDQLIGRLRRKRKRVRIRTRALSAAAVVLLLFLAGLVFWHQDSRQSERLIVVTTAYGQTEKIVLPDGSRVILNANSTLRYPHGWDRGVERQVWLTGEAYFTVMPQPTTSTKFTVITNDLNVQVLGTVFNVHARDRGTRITLEEGKVTLQLQAKSPEVNKIEMNAGEQILYSAQTGELITERVDAAAQSSWKDGSITFDDITLGNLGDIIEETFGLPVVFRDANLKHKTITGAGSSDDLELLLESVEGAFRIKINRQDSLLIFE